MYVCIDSQEDLNFWQGTLDRIDINRIRREFDAEGLPEYMWDGVERWIMYGQLPGSFLAGLLFDKPVRKVIPSADRTNYHKMMEWCFFISFLPPILLEDHWCGTEYIRDAIAQAGLDKLSDE